MILQHGTSRGQAIFSMTGNQGNKWIVGTASVPQSTASTGYKVMQGCHSQGKMSEKRHFFQVREKSENFVDGQGNLERTWEVREKSGNLKINGFSRQTSENLFILFKRGKDELSDEIVLAHLPPPPHWELLL